MSKHSSTIVLAILTGFLSFTQVGPASSETPSAAPEEHGTWSRGLADPMVRIYREEEAGQGDGWALRKQALLEYCALANEKNELSLGEFKGDENAVAVAMEQDKAALVFHQLRKLAGEEIFSRVGKELMAPGPSSRGSWNVVRGLFEKETRTDLGWFFKQWIDRKGLPDLRLENAAARRNGNRFEVSFDLVQKGEAYTLEVPVFISLSQGGVKTDIVKTDSIKKHIVLYVDDEPSTLAVDRDYDLPRRLTDEERPPLLAMLFADKKPVIVLPKTGRETYSALIDAFKQRGAEEREAADLKESDIRSSNFVVLGSDGPFVARLFGKREPEKGAFSLLAKKNPWNQDKVVVIVQAESAGATSAFASAIFQYGSFSSLSFLGKEAEPTVRTSGSQRGMEMELREPAAVIDLAALKKLSDAIEGAEGKKIVYVGEYHDQYAHHLVQLQVLKGLYQKGPKIAVGMEMFQRPFQKVLDDYIAGAINEREFLKRSEYFKRWGFDFNLYKPILDFARAEKIPVIALNVRNEIPAKVSKSGMDSLTDEEKKEVPQQMDFSDEEYRDRLKKIFNRHRNTGERNFDFFFQAQILWDETMSLSVDEFLKKNPDFRMVVFAGGGHLAYGSGIPKRAFRRNGFPYLIVLNDGDVDRDIADYVVLPQALEGAAAPMLMVALKIEDNRLAVTDMPDDSVSRKAGIKVNDAILSIDGTNVESVEDLKLELFFKKKDDVVKVKILRKRFLLGEKEMEFDVKL
jgi:aminopeptidase N